jgi:EAL domain-containing protein (putative c-di-GMP-specific phosphodiesterase class I)
MDDASLVIDTLRQCRDLGVELSLDDFGTGYSSLDYFRKLPAHEIKIDRSFVNDMLDDPESDMVVTAILGLARSFGRRVVAEGIENAEHHARLIELGCDLGQGFYYARPMPYQQAYDWAANFRWQTVAVTAVGS